MGKTSIPDRDIAQYSYVEEYRVRYDDLDTYRHVNNKSFLAFVEDARVRYLAAVTGLGHHVETRNQLLLVHASIDYVSQINAFESVRVGTRCVDIGRKSVTLHHVIEAGPEGGQPTGRRVAAVSVSVFASVDKETNRSCPNDPDMVARLREYEELRTE